jgi:hypothetical protein
MSRLHDVLSFPPQSKKKVDVIYRTACGEDVVLGETLAMAMIVSGGPNQVPMIPPEQCSTAHTIAVFAACDTMHHTG